ncbi:MAG: adenylate/guanylate cyclase domain-containing protein [Pseudomonadota bacterium]|nr:adenylate/guanylate cyclase domain-containing protein [Pseudomonadota bacterium]
MRSGTLASGFRNWLHGGRRDDDSSVDARLRAEQVFGFRVAGVGRVAVIGLVALYTPIGFPPQTRWYVMLALVVLAAFSLAQAMLADRDWFLRWGKHLFVFIDGMALMALLVIRNPFQDNLWTTVQAFRLEYHVVLFAWLGSIALTNAPAVVLAAGAALAAVWFAISVSIMNRADVVTWLDLTDNVNPKAALDLFLRPDFFDINARILEIVVILGLSGLLALAAWRGRAALQRFADAETERRRARDTFGRYVPADIARRLLADEGMLAPERREATVLFADIEGFTASSEHADPAEVLDMLNAYYDAVGEVVSRHGGIVTQFQGDGLLASFSPPLASPNPALAAIRTAFDIARLTATRDFLGRRFAVRIGIASGPVIAGTLGGRARLSWTVIGDTVNLAARLEQLNKERGTRLLVCGATARQAGTEVALRPIGSTTIRGRAGEVELFTPA